jgi:uncharacterized protein DUF6308
MVGGLRLVLGTGPLERAVPSADTLLTAFRQDSGYAYYRHQPVTPADRLFPEDLAVTLLVNSRAEKRAVQSLLTFGATLDLADLPDCSLESTTDEDLRRVAEVVGRVATWPGFAASLATKTLHKKRPRLIPILDNQAVFGAYLNPRWPVQRSRQDSVKSVPRIEQALRAIRHDLVRRENAALWDALQQLEPSLARIELFDAVWWMYFRQIEPVQQPGV